MSMALVERHEAPFCSRATLIASGYRKESDVWTCLASVFKWHNEAVNIWSHLLGALLFFVLYLCNTDQVLTSFCLMLTAGFSASGFFHILCCNSTCASSYFYAFA